MAANTIQRHSLGAVSVGAFIDDDGDGGFAGNLLRTAGSVAVKNITDVTVFGRAVALAPFWFYIRTSPGVAEGAFEAVTLV